MANVHGKSAHVDHAIQKYEETPFEADSRKAANFPKIEELVNFKRFSAGENSLVDKITGLLGSKNPFSKKARAKDNEVWLLDNTAYQRVAANGQVSGWEAEFVACYFQTGRKDITKAVSYIVDAIGLDGKVGTDDAVRQVIAQRLMPFVTAIAPARTIDINIPTNDGPPQKRTLGPSNASGISSQIIQIGSNDAANGTTITSTSLGTDSPKVAGKTRFAEPEGWAIISDIDDTIKITQTSNPVGILQTTFAEAPKITTGMPEFYQMLDAEFEQPPWFYLSASPYNLYPFLHTFIHEYYPPGTIILRDSSWMFFGGLLQSLTQGVQAYKTDRMSKIHSWLPQRKIICVGDSTQTDPESYADLYRRHPEWIKAIYIRKVLDAPFLEKKNEDSRFVKAFEGVPESVWKVFVMPTELAEHVRHLVGDRNPSTRTA